MTNTDLQSLIDLIGSRMQTLSDWQPDAPYVPVDPKKRFGPHAGPWGDARDAFLHLIDLAEEALAARSETLADYGWRLCDRCHWLRAGEECQQCAVDREAVRELLANLGLLEMTTC